MTSVLFIHNARITQLPHKKDFSIGYFASNQNPGKMRWSECSKQLFLKEFHPTSFKHSFHSVRTAFKLYSYWFPHWPLSNLFWREGVVQSPTSALHQTFTQNCLEIFGITSSYFLVTFSPSIIFKSTHITFSIRTLNSWLIWLMCTNRQELWAIDIIWNWLRYIILEAQKVEDSFKLTIFCSKILQETQYIVFRHKNKKLVTVGALLVPDDAGRKKKNGQCGKKRLKCKNRKLRVW